MRLFDLLLSPPVSVKCVEATVAPGSMQRIDDWFLAANTGTHQITRIASGDPGFHNKAGKGCSDFSS